MHVKQCTEEGTVFLAMDYDHFLVSKSHVFEYGYVRITTPNHSFHTCEINLRNYINVSKNKKENQNDFIKCY
jgi:hypothetical protein